MWFAWCSAVHGSSILATYNNMYRNSFAFFYGFRNLLLHHPANNFVISFIHEVRRTNGTPTWMKQNGNETNSRMKAISVVSCAVTNDRIDWTIWCTVCSETVWCPCAYGNVVSIHRTARNAIHIRPMCIRTVFRLQEKQEKEKECTDKQITKRKSEKIEVNCLISIIDYVVNCASLSWESEPTGMRSFVCL